MTFDELGVAQELLSSLKRLKLTTPTPIQEKSIPIALEGKDMVGIAQTGTGKTLAFGLPMIQRLGLHKGRGLVILPTRELALQVEETFRKVAGHLGLRTAILIGGASMERQRQMINAKPHVLIATPGRLIDHLQSRTIKLDDVKVLVLDEADRMFDMGFAPQIKKILAAVPNERHTMLFSATMPPEIMKLASGHMKLPVRVEIARAGTAAERVSQELFFVGKDQKTQLLKKLLEQYHGTVLVFSRTKHGAKKITRSLNAMGFKAAEIHSNRSLNQRREALDGFKSGKYRVLVATDIAARGIDVTGIELVVNYDLPDQSEDYVHRIGRTGRAGREGHAISFATPDQRKDVRDIERLMRKALTLSALPELPALPPREARPESSHDSARPSGRSHQGGRPYRGGGRPQRGGGRPSHHRRGGRDGRPTRRGPSPTREG